MSCEVTEGNSLCIIAYGNRQRRDDGVGSYIVESLAKSLRRKEHVKFLVLRQLEVDVVEDLGHTDLALFVDASIEPLDGGWQWTKLEPNIRHIHFTSHHLQPSYLLGLTLLLYGRCPEGRQLAIQGERFTFGEELSRKTRKRADALIVKLARWVSQGRNTQSLSTAAEENQID